VSWEATTSYGGGTSLGPQAILEASRQIDLFDFELGNFYEAGIAMAPTNKLVAQWNAAAKKLAQPVIKAGGPNSQKLKAAAEKVNAFSDKINTYVYLETKKYLAEGKVVGVVGGDHSTPFGAIQAHLEVYPKMGILHFDAHADMRDAYEGFKHSHASIMFNVLEDTSLNKLVQVGIRDFCEDEFILIGRNKNRVATFFDGALAEQKMTGKNWSAICDDVIAQLPQQVYVSFDIDGLDPRYCPHTGTPVPGGLDFQEAALMIKKVVKSGRKIVGFDLNEVAPSTDDADEWDANVGARLLYKLCAWSLV
jgi:agmatinase